MKPAKRKAQATKVRPPKTDKLAVCKHCGLPRKLHVGFCMPGAR